MVKYKVKKKEKAKGLKYIDEPKSIGEHLTNATIETQYFKKQNDNIIRQISGIENSDIMKRKIIAYINRISWRVRNLQANLYEITKMRLEEKDAVHKEGR